MAIILKKSRTLYKSLGLIFFFTFLADRPCRAYATALYLFAYLSSVTWLNGG